MNLKRLFTSNAGVRRLARTLGLSVDGRATCDALPYKGVRRRTVAALDTSQSMEELLEVLSRLEAAKMRALEYVRLSGAANSANEVAFISFDLNAQLICPFTRCTQLQEIEQRLMPVGVGTSTNIAAPLHLAHQLFSSSIAEWNCEFLVHLLTDGHHNAADDPLGAANVLKSRGVIVDVVGFAHAREAVDEALLREIASDHPNGGKRYEFCRDPKGLADHYQHLAGRLSV